MKKVLGLHAWCLVFFFIAVFVPARGLCAQPAENKYIYLTFDDGPLAGSENIDAITLREQIKISVFVVGNVMETNTRLRKYFALYEKNPYIDVYNHSFSHANDHYAEYYKNPEGVLEDMVRNEKEYHLPYKIVRLPGGNIWRIGSRKTDAIRECTPAADLLAEKGYTVVGWDLEWNHDRTKNAPVQSVAQLLAQIDHAFAANKMFTPGHLVLLMHDEMFKTNWEGSELKQLIDALRKKGYFFRHIREYPQAAGL